jgi:flagellum-specific peptidoglycan hydrolase FlgJ
MNNQSLLIIKNKTQSYWLELKPKIKVAFIKFSFIFLLFILISNQEISFHIHIGNTVNTKSLHNNRKHPEAINAGLLDLPPERDQNTATLVILSPAEQEQAAKYSNLGFILSPDYAKRKGIDSRIVTYKAQKCYDYINKYKATAEEEASLYGIPVAITLAQGLLESNVGDSKLALNDNNHFGIKCRAKCIGCRCANYTDDSKYDMFRVFDSPWYSFREHSNLLIGKRYKHLNKLPRTDYKNWAYGLKAAGYATDKDYAAKLINIIESMNLQRFDL